MRLVICGVMLALVGCAAIVPVASPQLIAQLPPDHPQANVDLVQLQEGRSLYLTRCGGCHKLRTPSALSSAQWKHVLTKMDNEAKLTVSQQESVLLYLAVASDAMRNSPNTQWNRDGQMVH